MYKVVVTDIDDTLLDSKGQLTNKTINIVEQCIKKDVKVMLASGRPDFGMLDLVKKLKLDSYDNYLLSYNGAKLTNLSTGELVYDKLLSAERLKFLVDKALEHHCDILTYQNDKVLTNRDNKFARIEADLLGVDLIIKDNIKDYIVEKAAKVLILAEPEIAKIIKEKLVTEIGDDYEITISKPFFIEVNDKGISKGKALEVLCKKMGISSEEMFAIGDGLNDMSMIEFAGMGVAMDNANSLLKEKANYITKTNDEDGFSFAINKFVVENNN